jgi:hypothetical protein
MFLASLLLLIALAWFLFISHRDFTDMVSQVFVLDKVVDTPPDSPEIFSINQADVDALTREFYDFQYKKAARSAAVAGAAVGVGGAVLTAGGAFATTGGGTGGGASSAAEAAAASIAAGVTNAINMIRAIDGIGLAAFGVALAPMGFMVTLRVLNMVLSRV